MWEMLMREHIILMGLINPVYHSLFFNFKKEVKFSYDFLEIFPLVLTNLVIVPVASETSDVMGWKCAY